MPKTRVYDEAKFRELVLYVADKMQDAPWYGATVLNKVLFFADFYHYADYGKPITGAVYHRLDFGPAPKRLLPVRDELIASGRAVMRERSIGARQQQRLEAVAKPDLARFSAVEIKTVDEVIELLRGHTASTVSEVSHLMNGWKLAAHKETIPYETVFLSSTRVTDKDRAAAEGLRALAAAALN